MDKYSQAQKNALNLAKKYKEEGLYKKAIQEYERCIDDFIDEGKYDLYKEVAVCYSLDGDTKKAIDFFLLYIDENENDVESLYYVAQLYNELEKYDKAEEYCLKVLSINDKVIPVFFLLTEIYERKNEDDKAEKCLINVTELEPSNSYFKYVLGDFYFRQKKFKKAKDNFEVAKQLGLKNPNIYYRLGISYLELHKFEKAKFELRKYRKKYPRDMYVYKEFLKTLKKSEKISEVEKIIEGNDLISRTKLATIYIEDDKDRASELFREILENTNDVELKKYIKGVLNEIK